MTNAAPTTSSLRRVQGRRYDRLVTAAGEVVAYHDWKDGRYFMVTASGARAENDLWSLPLLVQRYGPIR